MQPRVGHASVAIIFSRAPSGGPQAPYPAAMREEMWDAVVVGGGPAGSAFALELAGQGQRVVLLERTQSAQHKVCGEFLSRETVELLSYLDVDVGTLGATRIDQFRLVAGDRAAEISLPFAARALSRFRLDEALLARAERIGVRVVRGARVVGVDASGEGAVVKTENAAWPGRVVGLATGKHALRGIKRPLGVMAGFKMHIASPNAARVLANAVQLVFFRGGYLGACIVEEGVLSVGWVIKPDVLREVGAHWHEQAAFLSRQSPFATALLRDARPLFEKPVSTAAIPYGFLRSAEIAPSIYPLGDQLAVVPSFTGDGLAIALASGVAAARGVIAKQTAGEVQRTLIGKMRPQFWIAGALGRMLETPALSPVTITAARMLPRVARQMVKATRLRGFAYLLDRSALHFDLAPRSVPVD